MDTLTERAAEIDGIIETDQKFEHVVVGQILEINPHPDADRVRVTKTEVGDGQPRQIICGATNIEVGQKIPVALPGAVLPGNFVIEKRKMRGVESEGMLCSGKELGITEDAEGIMILAPETPLGVPFAKVLHGDSTIYDIENTAITNRPDLFSHWGFAREMVALDLAEWKRKDFDFREVEKVIPKVKLPINFKVESDELCPARAEVVIENLKVAPSPDWLQQRLQACGIRPISNLVDVSNYVMLELGMPLHIFDLENIAGNTITMRESKEGEIVETLDNIKRKLPAGVIIQEDADKIFDLAGIMGGANSEISDSTTRVLVHVPVYDPIRIRKAMLALAHRTDAATIYEKRVPNALVLPGIKRTIQLLLELCPEMKITSEIEFVEHVPDLERILALKNSEVSRVIGEEIPLEKTKEILAALDFKIVDEKDEVLQVKIPGHRLTDITIPADLLEETSRIYGLNQIAPRAPQITMRATKYPRLFRLRRELSDFLVGKQFFELLNFSFLGPDLLKKCDIIADESYIEIDNPLSGDMSLMRQSLLPRLLEKAAENLRHRKEFCIFEIGKVFQKIPNGETLETLELAALNIGANFVATKSVLEALFAEISFPIRLENSKEQSPFANQSASIMLGNNLIGEIFELKKSLTTAFELPDKVTGFVFDINALASFKQSHKKILSVPKFPAIDLDLSVLADCETYVGEILSVVKRVDDLVESVEVLEVFEGKGVAIGKKSVTLHFRFRAQDRTLASSEADALRKKILAKLAKKGFPFRF